MTPKRNPRGIDLETPWNQRLLFKYGSRLLLGITVIIVFLTMAQCTIKKPESPEWSTRMTVPVVNRTYDMEELVDNVDQEGLEIGEGGIVTFSITEDLDTVMLDASALGTDNLSYTVTQSLGVISIDPPVIAPVSVSLSSITGLSSGLPGDQATISAMSFDVTNSMPEITNFSQATIASGNVLVVVRNYLGTTLDTAIIELYDVGNAATLVTDTFPSGIPAGGTDSLTLSLDGKSLSSSLRVNGQYHISGGTIDSVSTRYVSTELVFPDELTVSSAIADVPALNMSFAQEVELDESERIDTASLAGGQLELTITNATNLNANLTIGIPDLETSGTAMSIDVTVPALGTVQIVRALAGSKLIPGGSTLPQLVNINVIADVPGSDGEQVSVNQSDSFFVQADLISLTFGSITGVFSSTEATFNAESFEIDIPTGFDSLELVSAVLTLDVENGTNLPGYLDILLSGDNGKTLALTGDIAIGASGAPVITTIINSNIAEFISPLPGNVEASGTVTFGDGVTQSTINANDFVFSRVGIVAPLEMVINETHTLTDIKREAINQEDIDLVTDHVIEAGFVYNIISHLPLGASVEIFLGPDSTTLYSNPGLTIGPLEIIAAPVSGDGLVIDTSSTGYQEIMLTNADIQVLKSDTLYIGQELILAGSDGQSVKLMQDDFITVIGRFEVEYNFDGEF